jgi:nucleotide-binding universal stress UspA family protein
MKTILVPTDFSKNAEKAFQFALMLAEKQHARIILLHVYNLAYMNPETPFRYIEEEAMEIESKAKTKLGSMQKKFKMPRGIIREALVREGMVVEVIPELVTKKKIDLVVMGTKGASGLKEVFLGSNTSAVISKVTCPVIAVPERSSPGKLKTITYASDYHASDIKVIKKVTELARLFKANVEILHVSDVENSDQLEKEIMMTFMKRVRLQINYPNLCFIRIIGNDQAGTIRRYIDESETDLLVMSAHHRNLADRLFGRSITKKVVNHIQVPLMAFHHKKSHVLL